MKEQKEIINRLNEIDFHDIPVEKIFYKTELSTDFVVGFLLYSENKKDYDSWTISFIDIKTLKSDSLELNNESELEINSFDYEFNELFKCKIIFLLGFSQPTFEVELECKKIVLIQTKIDV